MIDKTKPDECAELCSRIPTQLTVILPAPLVIGGGGHVIPAQSKSPGTGLIRRPFPEIDEVLHAGIDPRCGNDIVWERRPPRAVRIAGLGIEDRCRGCPEIPLLHRQ